MNITARPARVADVAELRAILAELTAEIRDERGGALQIAERAALTDGHLVALERGAATTPGAGVVVAEIDGVVVGLAAVRVVDLGPVRLGVIDAYGVLADAREVGAGEALLDVVLARCRDAGCVGVDADALPGARATKNFFETFGFTARRLVVHHRFADEATPAPPEGP